jgi:hypothetical protein
VAHDLLIRFPMKNLYVFILFALFSSSVALAKPPPEPVVKDDTAPSISITISPLLLFLPIVELTGEYRISEHLGIAAIVGGGSVAVKDAAGNKLTSAAVIEIGASARYYVLGSFRKGVQLGAEVNYLHAGATKGTTDVIADGLAIGPFVGGKWISSFGLTFDGQLGIQGIALKGESSSATTKEKSYGPLLNLNIGYSF